MNAIDMSMTARHGYAVYNSTKSHVVAWCISLSEARKLTDDASRIQNVQNGAFFVA